MLFVVIGHIYFWDSKIHLFFLNIKYIPVLGTFSCFIYDGFLGVNVFFVISGFLITTLLINEEKKFGQVNVLKFLARRTFRIFPAYYFLLIVYAVLCFMGVMNISPLSWVTSIFYSKYFNYYFDWYTGSAWSLGVEEHFYLLYIFIFPLKGKFRSFFVAILILIIPLIRLYIAQFYDVRVHHELTFYSKADAVGWGCLIALKREWFLSKLRQYFQLVFNISILGVIFCSYLPNYLFFKLPFQDFPYLNYSIQQFIQNTVEDILISIVILYSVFGSELLWFKFLNSKVMNWLGLMSYSIYLWQQIFTYGKGWWSLFPLNLLFILIAALISYHLIEKPFLRLKEKFSV